VTAAEAVAPETAALALAGEVTIYRVSALRQALLEALERANVVEVDLSQVSELDTAGAQLLLFGRRAAEARGKELHLRAPSAAVVEVFELLNLRHLTPNLASTP
jgi:anti-anti-sigma factor